MTAAKTVFILGYGSSGKAAERLAKALGYETKVFDGDARVEGAADLAIASPGVPMTSPLITACRERGIPIVSEMQFGCEELKRRGWKLVAVTGSKGKSSVVKLLADALGGVACGNYGLPVCDVAANPQLYTHPSNLHLHLPPPPLAVVRLLSPVTQPNLAVVEVSSFMMETTCLPSDFFDAAAVLNLQEDHLDRHGSVAVYHALKLKLLDFAKIKVSPLPSTLYPLSSTLYPLSSTLYPLPLQSTPSSGSYFDNAILRGNANAAISILRSLGLSESAIAAAFARFEPLPHRFTLVDTIDGVRYIDDSKATSIAAMIAGLTMAAEGLGGGKVLLIAGGLPKGDDPRAALPHLTDWVKKVYIIGCCAEKFAAAWSGSVECEISTTLERAVEASMRDACSGDCVLLSPGCASFDQFKSFGERGDRFADFVKKGKKKK